MRKSFFLTLIFTFIFSISAFAFGKKNIAGYIQVYGNAPLTFIGFTTDEGEEYSIDIDSKADFTIDDIKIHQGKYLKLTGIVNEKELLGFQTLKDGRFIVSKFKIIEEKQ